MKRLIERLQQVHTSEVTILDLLHELENLDIQPQEWKYLASQKTQDHSSQLWWRITTLLKVYSGDFGTIVDQLQIPVFQEAQQHDPILRLHLAQTYIGLGQIQPADTWLRTIEPPEKPRHAFWYWSTKAMLAIYLEQPFDDAFNKAAGLCQGHEQGVIHLNWAFGFERNKQLDKAVFHWQEALKHLRLPSYALALTHYNLGQSFLAEINPEAQYQFELALKLSRYAVAARLRPAILCGLGSWQCLHGHLHQAENTYQRALVAATKFQIIEDQIHALAKLGFISMLKGRLETALEQIHQATALIPDVYSSTWVHTIEALLHLKRLDLVSAERTLARAVSLGNVAQERARVIRAELKRRQGHLGQTLIELQQLNLTNIGARETVLVLPELWAWVAAQGMQIPEPILELKRVFKVKTLDQFEVWAGQKKVVLAKRSAELLVYFLHYQTRDAKDMISELYYEELDREIDSKLRIMKFKQYKKNFNQHLKRLRDALQWQDVIRLKNGLYSVNLEDAIWDLDWIGQTKNELQTRFLRSVQRHWVKDIAEPF